MEKKLFINALVFMDNDVLRLPEVEAGRTDDQSWFWMSSCNFLVETVHPVIFDALFTVCYSLFFCGVSAESCVG